MNEIQHNVQYKEDEIDLRELLMALWKQKIMIISAALIVAILAGMFSMFMISPVYDTKLNIVISIPETYNTKYGEYKLPITTNGQYINLITSNDVLVNTIKGMGYNADEVTLENLRERISIDKVASTVGVVQNSFDVKVSSDNSKDSLKLAQTVYDKYIDFMNVMTNERAISYYYDKFSVDLKSQAVLLKSEKEILKKNNDILAVTPQTINQKAAMDQLTNTKDYVVLENIINPNYTEVEKTIIENKQKINTIEDTMRVDKENIIELDKEKISVAKYYETGKVGKLESSIIGAIETSIYLPSQPVAPSKKTSPSNARNAAIGLILGGMLGVMVTLAKHYWVKKA